MLSLLKGFGLKKRMARRKNFDNMFFKLLYSILQSTDNLNLIIFKSYGFDLSKLYVIINLVTTNNYCKNFVLLNTLPNYLLRTKRKRRLKRKVTKRLSKLV